MVDQYLQMEHEQPSGNQELASSGDQPAVSSEDGSASGERKPQPSCGDIFRSFILPSSRKFSGSDVRDRTSMPDFVAVCSLMVDLANERTFMSWMRSALASAALGVVLMRSFTTQGRALALGLFLVGLGVVIMLFSAYRYYYVMYLLEEKRFDPAKMIVAIFSIVVVGVTIALTVLLVV
jgi:putative membrane protein